MIKFATKYNLSLPKFKFKEDLMQVAKDVIIPDIKRRMDAEVNIGGEVYPPLADSTLQIKLKRGQSLEILEAEGKLKKSMFHKAIGETKVLISLGAERKQIGKYLQVDGVKSKKLGRRYFKFFGISDIAEKNAVKLMEKKINKAIGNGGR